MSILAAAVGWDGDPGCGDCARRMVGSLAARAPDGQAVVQAPGAALAFGKLIVSHKQGHAQQPLVDEAAGLTLVADVRLDNRDELRGPLGLPARATDAEIVLRGYRKWGALVTDHLVGDFALCLWDARQRRLFAARDPFGVRPLVYRQGRGRLLVASDVEQILAVDPDAWKVDDVAVVDFLLRSWRDPDRTFWEPIRALPAGHALLARAGGVEVMRWWRPPREPEILTDHEACYREFRARFDRAVADRLESDHPVLIHVSGGFDSSSIALTAGEIGARVPLRGVGAIHPGLDCDESIYMDAVRARLPYPLEYWDGTRPHFLDLEDPALAGPGRRSTHNSGTRGDLAIALREGARVILSGYGGDVWEPCAQSLRDYVGEGQWRQAWIAGFMRPGRSWRERLHWLRFSLRFLAPEPAKRLARALRGVEIDLPDWLPPAWAAVGRREAPGVGSAASGLGAANRQRLEELAGATSTLILDLQHETLPGAQVEKRYPFLDVRLLDLLWRLPLSIWRSPGYEARFHRWALADRLPEEIRSLRRKTGFSSAIARRTALACSGQMAGPAKGAAWRAARYFAPGRIEALLEDVRCRSTAGARPHARPQGPSEVRQVSGQVSGDLLSSGVLWRLLVLEAWLEMVYRARDIRADIRVHPGETMQTNESEARAEAGSGEGGASGPRPYEPPVIKPIGNVHALLAMGKTKSGDDGMPICPVNNSFGIPCSP